MENALIILCNSLPHFLQNLCSYFSVQLLYLIINKMLCYNLNVAVYFLCYYRYSSHTYIV